MKEPRFVQDYLRDILEAMKQAEEFWRRCKQKKVESALQVAY